MRKSILPLLLAGVVMPFAAFAQDAQPGATPATPPAETSPAPSEPAAPTATPPAASEPAPAADASGGTTADKAPDASSGDAGMAGDTTNKMDTAATQTADGGTFVTVPPTGAWRTTDLDGKSVYGADGESIGSISDVLVSEDGKVMAVLVGVGGFLGIGEKDVAVSMTALEFGPGKTEGLKTEAEADASTSAAAPASTGAAAPDPAAGGGAAPAAPAASAEPTQPVVGDDNLPDRIVLNVTREELENAPAYDAPEEAAAPDAPAADDATSSTGDAAGSAAPAPAN